MQALDSGDVEEIIAARQALNSKLYSYNKSTAQVYGAEARRLFGNQAKSAKAQLISLKDEIAVYNAFEEIERNVVLGQYTKAGLQIDRIEKKLDKVRSKDSTFAKNIVANADGIINRIRGSLTIVGDDQGNKLINGTAKTYTVTLKHPGTGKPIAGAKLNVTFEENLETNFKPQRNVGITDDDNDYVVPYQSTDGKEEEAVIRTDKNGKATFTVTGTNGTVTPIVFLDGSNQEWDTKGGKLPEPQDGRFDEDVEIAAYADSVTFGVTEYKIEVEGKRTNHAAVVDEDRSQINGREYKITVTKPNGDPWVGGEVNVGIDELLDGKLGNNPRGAFLVKDDDVFDEDERYEQLRLKLDGEGQAEFFLASTKVNDSARPVVWIDQNNANGSYDGRLEDGEPVSDRDEVDPTNFQPPYVDSEKLGAKLEVRDGTDADFRYWENHFEEIPDDLEDVKGFKFSLLNQSGNPFLPDSYNDDAKDARVTFEVENTGPNLVKVHTAGFLENSSLKNPVGADDTDISDGVIRIGVGGKVTIAGDIIDWADWLDINSAVIVTYSVGGDSSVDVRASAVVDGLSEDYESRSISVSTDYVSVDLNNRIDEDEDDIIQDVEEKDTDKDGYIDQIILTFDREVHNFEAGDFRLIEGAHDTDYSTAVKVEYGKKDENIVETEKKKLVITVNEFDGFEDSDSKLYYDGNFSGSKELTDEYGTKVRAFVVDEDGAENVD